MAAAEEPDHPAETEPAPTEPAPTEPAVTEPAVTEPAVTEPAPTEPAPKLRVRRPPEQTTDDTDAGWGERGDESEHDRWLREQRPPHWE